MYINKNFFIDRIMIQGCLKKLEAIFCFDRGIRKEGC